jgi:hypothetical protein
MYVFVFAIDTFSYRTAAFEISIIIIIKMSGVRLYFFPRKEHIFYEFDTFFMSSWWKNTKFLIFFMQGLELILICVRGQQKENSRWPPVL